ncbi:prion-like-(Q/N-rich) domain-bearing protein 25 [Cotesia glomerata]|nr:prion-like-(Q/N-rich) domain-bearing protein 25 [Cotesia glomerata]
MPLLGGFCWKNETCATDNTICIDNQCQCRANYIENGKFCFSNTVNRSCLDNTDCVGLKWSECSKQGACTCQPNTVLVKNTCVPQLDVHCNLDTDCRVKNFKCIDNTCQCTENFMFRRLECVPKISFESCKKDADCNQIPFAECSIEKKCECKHNFIATDHRTCKPLLGEFCANDEDCQTLNSECDHNECVCRDDYVQESIYSCIPTLLGQFCREDNDCNNIKNAECNNKVCVCKSDYVSTDLTTCLLLLGRQCTKRSDCAPDNSACLGGICDCNEYFISKSDDKCLPTLLEKKCQDHLDCHDKKFSLCGQNKVCACSFYYVASNGNECEPLLGGKCNNTSQCMVDNSICLNNRCRCKPHFLQSFHTYCIPIMLGRSCTEQTQCKTTQNSICVSNVCVCRDDHFAFNGIFCIPVLNRVCWTNDQCSGDSFHCSNYKCQCRPGFTAVSVEKCVKTDSLFSCNDETECSDIWHSTCSTKKCVCRSNNIAVSKSTCLPILRGYCWKDDQCKAENSACINYWCKCKPGFTEIAINSCAAIVL